MPKFRVTGPDGATYEVNAPEGASEQDVLAFVQQNVAKSAAPAPEGGGVLRTIDDIGRGFAAGATGGFADEAAAGAASLTGIGGTRGDYEGNLAAQRERDKAASPYVRIPAEIAGALTPAGILARGGLTLMRMAQPTVRGLMGRGAAEGAAYGAVQGFGQGEGGAGERLESAAEGAALGGAAGGALGAVGGKLAQTKPPTTEQLRASADAAYTASKQAGVVIKSQSFDNAVGDIVMAAQQAGIDKAIHPKATAALQRLVEGRGTPPSLEDVDILRRVLRSAAASIEPDERRIAGIMIDKLDDFVGGMTASDIAAGKGMAGVRALNEARTLWSRMRKSEAIEELIDRARLSAPNFSASGMENALRTEFRALSKSAKRMRTFTPAEQQAIRKVARGGPIVNALRFIGRFAPTGPVSGMAMGGAATMLGGPAGLAAMGTAIAGRTAAKAMTVRNANRAAELARSGGNMPAPRQLSPTLEDIFRGVAITAGQQGSGGE